MTPPNIVNKLFTVGLTTASLSFSANAIAQQPDEDFCAEIAKCNEDKPKKPVKKTCSQEYEQGICLPTDLATSVLGPHAEYKTGLCPGGVDILCFNAEDAQNHNQALNRLTREGIKIRKDHDALKNTVDNHLKSTEHLHKVYGKALEPELKRLDIQKNFYEANCQSTANLDFCAASIMNYEDAIEQLVQIIRRNLLDTPENERFRMSILIDDKIHDYMKKDIERTKKMIDDSTVKLSFMGTLGYQFSALNTSADSSVSHIFTPGIEACLYTPSELFGLCLTGNLFVGNTTSGGLGSERIYNFNLPVEVDAQDHGDYSSVNTVETDVNIARITYGSAGMTAKLGGFIGDNLKLSFLASLNLEVGREYTSTFTQGTNELSYQGDSVDTHKVSDVEETDGIFLEVTPQAGAEVCYDLGINRTCGYGKLGPSFPTGDGNDITLTGGFGLGTGFHF